MALLTRPESENRSPAAARRPIWPWLAAGFAAICMTAGALIEAVVFGKGVAQATSGGVFEALMFYLLFVSFPLFGAVVLRRMPGNRLGVVFILFGLVGGIGFLGQTYAHLGLVEQPGRWPFATLGAWIEQWYWYPTIALLLLFVPLLFPNGRVPSPRWLVVQWVATGGLAVVVVGGMLEGRLKGDGYSVDNPLGIAAIKDVEASLGPVFLVLAVCMLLAMVSLFQRYRHADREQRQQLKWFTFAIAFAVGGAILGDLLELPEILFSVMLAGLMAGIAISVLKYRLYDIDVIINRTLVYGVLTAVLLGSYLLIVVALSRVLAPVTRDSDVAVAASTLAVAALFGPLRARIQGFIDRRFYRAKYDAVAALNQFGARLRDEVDLDLVRSDVLSVVANTMQPRHASLWIAGPEQGR